MTEEMITDEDRAAILATHLDFEEGVKEIFFQCPNEKSTQLLSLCSPWLEPARMEQTLQDGDSAYYLLSHGEGCDLSTNAGFQLEEIQKLKPEWLRCHVPRGPPKLFAEEASWTDQKLAAKAKRYLRVIRHLLLLSRDHVMSGGTLIWLVPSSSQVGTVKRFWNCYGKGPPVPLPVPDQSQMFSNVLEICDYPPGTPLEKFWSTLLSTTDAATSWMLDAEANPIYPVDTSCLETLTTMELGRLMQHVRQLRRRFGHPSNRLLVKNLIHQNADEKVIAASKLECDECLESQIKMPSPAVNLDKCEKLWSCLQVDGFHLRCGATVYRYLLMVDEASGFAVIREMFSRPEEDHQNMTGPDVVHTLQEAWFQYTLDTRKPSTWTWREPCGAGHCATCLDKGIDLLPAPAEYRGMIADVEREIGYLRGGSFEKPGQAALAAVAAHNSLARVHGFSPLQWAVGRDMSLGNRAGDAPGDQISSARSTTFLQQNNLPARAICCLTH